MNKNFLSKKSWHTGSLKHIEKVWKAEQRNEEEQRKLKELKRQLEQERELHKLQEIKDESGLYKKKVERLDWLYEPPMAFKTQSTEEYLLGKPFEDKKEAEDLSTPGLFQNKTQSSSTEAWNKLREDPLLVIKKQEQSVRENIKNNPVEMKLIKEKLIAMEKASKQKKKQKKLEKKKKKEELSKNSSSYQSLHSRSRSRSRSRSPSYSRHSRSHSPSHSHHSRSRSPSSSHSRTSNSRLQNSNGKGNGTSPQSFQRPRGRYDYRKEKPSTYMDHPPQYNPSKMTEEERKQLLEEMMKDAEVHQISRTKRLKRSDEIDELEKAQELKKAPRPRFINQLNKEIYSATEEGVEERLKRNIHFRQKGVQEENGIFK